MSTDTISQLHARRIWDSRGRPTVEIDVVSAAGARGRGVAPAGASRGAREAIDLRDGGRRLGGYGVQRALAAVNEVIAPALLGQAIAEQAALDAALIDLDGTPDKSRLGGNALVATSLALLDCAARSADRPLWAHVAELTGNTPLVPLPQIQIFGGGAHAGRRVDVQDFMIVVPGAQTFAEALEVTAEVYRAAGEIMARRGALAGVADEGGWWPDFDTNEAALATLLEAIEAAGETPGERVAIALDIAASEFGTEGRYTLGLEERALGREEWADELGRWLDAFPIASAEDPFGEDDRDGMALFTQRYGERVQVVGDDYLVTNAALVSRAAEDGACNAVLVKANQAGTVSETFAAASAAATHGFGAIVSARSGETEDVAIAHLATGLGCGQLKVGSFARSERMAKWNECLRIAESLGVFAGSAPLGDRAWTGRGD